MTGTIKNRLYQILEMHDIMSLSSRLINGFIMLLIIINVVAVILESVHQYQVRFGTWFLRLEQFSIAIFTVEYLLRIWVCNEAVPAMRGWRARLKYMRSPMAIIDLVAIAPFYLGMFFNIDMRILRILRLFRVFKLSRHFAVMGVLGTVLRNESRTLLSALFIMFILVVLAASGIYLVEKDNQPDVFGSIPSAMWWATVTLTTVGYGDVVPQTIAGRFFGVLITVLGVGMAALPAGIIASGFTGELARRREQYEITARNLLEDGDIDLRDHEQLAQQQQDLGIAASDALHLLEKARMQTPVQKNPEQIRCPHCGKAFDPDN